MQRDDSSMRMLLIHLANAHNKRFHLRQAPEDSRNLIEYGTIALTLTSDDDARKPNLLSQLGTAHAKRFKCLGDKNDIEKAIEYRSIALELTPNNKNYPRLLDLLTGLGTSHSCRFQRFGELKDTERAIDYQSRALALTYEDHPDWPSRLAILAVSYRDRFKRLGDLNDLDQAIDCESRALDPTPDGHPNLPSRLANLSASHSSRFRRLGDLGDLEQAIEYASRALALTPDGHPDAPAHLANLAMSYRNRFQCLSELSYLEQAINYQSRALDLTSNSHLDFPIHLANLAVFYSDRFQRLNDPSDLEHAIKHQYHALALTPDSRPDSPIHLANLAVFYRLRFQRLGRLVYLEQAIDYESRALIAITQDHPDLCLWHFSHALSYIAYYDHSHDLFHLQQSLLLLRSACMSPSGAPRDKFRNAYGWALHASKHSILNAMEAYQATIDLLPQFIWFGSTVEQRYQDIKSIGNLAVDAAHVAILAFNYSLALEWLEHTRCVVWNQNLMLRSPYNELLSSHPALATDLQSIATELYTATLHPRGSKTFSRSMNSEQAAQNHRRLAKEYERLLAQARTRPGYENLLRPMKAAGLMYAALIGPIVVINCHEDSCDALIVIPGQATVSHLSLPIFSSKKAQYAHSKIQAALRRKGIRERGVCVRQEPGCQNDFGSMLKTLWTDVVKPILEFLGFITHAPAVTLPHITWCPTGAASFLPFHAAGDYDQPHSRIFDYVVSSYTPTLTALLRCTTSTLACNSRVLAIGQTSTPGHAPLPGATAELGHVRLHVEKGAGYSELIDAQATPTSVLDAMETHDWVHLACHAHQNITNPTKSGFFLHNGTLDLAMINRRSFRKKGLAFLSACQTATGDETLAEEAVHLASGMLMAGYSSIIATMWSIADSDAPFVADDVYNELMKGGTLGNGEAGRALHSAVKTLRARLGEKEFGRWVPFIHIGS